MSTPEQLTRTASTQRLALSLGALGVVYGDIGTSPLYALRECFHGAWAVEPTPANVLGILSLVFWSLVTVISLKYLFVVMRADNQGEGGILALVALALPRDLSLRGVGWWLALLGVFGASLLYGDGMLTPAISVLSAVEGLEVALPALHAWVVPVTVLILLGLFSLQSRGSERIGRWFGPVMVLWFAAIAALGTLGILHAPEVLAALWPGHALALFAQNGAQGFAVLASVFLVVTGGEALYADMGHFGRGPIRASWFTLVLPALLLNYFGQGALLLGHPELAENLFFALAPGWALVPLVALATAATVIASQALISGAFSLAHQAVQLGYSPRLRIQHTSEAQSGQIYVPSVNWLLMLASCALVVGFRSSANLAAAYGMAVTTTMAITTALFCVVAWRRWGWRLALLPIVLVFAPIDLGFLGSNLLKLPHGGWFALAVAAAGFALMSTWKRGRRVMAERLEVTSLPLEHFLPDLELATLHRASGTAVFMTGDPKGTPHALLHNIEHNRVIHEQTVFLCFTTTDVPHVPPDEQATVHPLGHGLYRIVAQLGFMDLPDVPALLARLRSPELAFDPMRTTFFLGHESVIPSGRSGMALWREWLFAFLSQNAQNASAFFRIPPNRVIELGAQIEL